ncbi:MAG: YbjN domain-containing protein [Myxococcota bacterium]|nr:YbjN domain-containing protein [Myxococcota bacterium]
MAGTEGFEEICDQVCQERGWKRGAHQIDVPIAGNRNQTVYFNFFDFEERAMVRLHTVIGSTARIRPERLTFALELNFRLPHGSLAVEKENLVMVDTLVLDEADSVELESSVDFLARTGDQYEAALFAKDEN